MAVNLKGKSFLTLMDLSAQEIRYLLDLGHSLKAKRQMGLHGEALKGKHIVLLFEKTSTRTRCSFEVAMAEEGGRVTYLDPGSSQMGKKESMEDTAKVLGRFLTASSTGATTRPTWRPWPNTPGYPCTTASPTWTTPPRSLRT